MSPAATRRFTVRLMLARQITRRIEAGDETTAAAIAEYLYANFGDRHFDSDAESLFDTDVSDENPEAAS